MKKSNKLLFGGFITLLVVLTAIHLGLYARYQAGQYSVYNADAESMQLFPNILVVSLNDISGATVQFSDAARVEKTEDKSIQYAQKGDTLVISAKDTARFDHPRHNFRVNVPYGARLSVFNSYVDFKPSRGAAKESATIYLDRSMAFFPSRDEPMRQGRLRVVASNESLLIFEGKAEVEALDLQLSQSSIEARESQFGQLSIATDSLSRLYLPMKYLVKANINSNR